MRFTIGKTEEHICDWGISPAMYVVHCDKECDADDAILREIVNDCNDRGYWAISNLVYLDTEEEVTMFMLRWS